MKRFKERGFVYEQEMPKVKGVADVVFVIDRSGSMEPFIDALRDVINDFFDKMQKEDGVDARIGLIGQTGEEFIIKNFTKNTNEMKNALAQFTPMGNEFTLPAIDWAADFPWDTTRKAHRIIVVITDEPLETGSEPDFQRSKMEELVQKLKDLKIKVLYFGYPCPEYRDFVQNKMKGLPVEIDFASISTQRDKLLEIIALIRKTVSNASLGTAQQSMTKVNKNIYGLPINGYPVIKNI